jgi:hypothetical protein
LSIVNQEACVPRHIVRIGVYRLFRPVGIYCSDKARIEYQIAAFVNAGYKYLSGLNENFYRRTLISRPDIKGCPKHSNPYFPGINGERAGLITDNIKEGFSGDGLFFSLLKSRYEI